MRATLEFDLPDEREELESALFDYKAGMVVWEMAQWLRGKVKYEDLSDEEDRLYEGVRDELYKIAAHWDWEIT